MITQFINLSNNKTFNIFKERYNLSFEYNLGLTGIELRNISAEFHKSNLIGPSINIFFSSDSILLVGSIEQIIKEISSSDFNPILSREILNVITKYQRNDSTSYELGKKRFNFNQSYVMGILNVTPDSFSDGGKYLDLKNAVDHGIEMSNMGADIIDIGCESTRPGSESIDEDEEINRVIPLIEQIISKKPDVVISIDTTKSNVAKAALQSGASIVNDISGGTFDKNIFGVLKDYNAGFVIMHIKDTPKTMQVSPTYDDVVSEVYDHLFRLSNLAEESGIKKIFIDTGIGFGKRIEDNLSLINRLEDFKSLGYPILIGLSRKNFIGKILNLPVEDRDDVSNSLNTLALTNGARIIRTHNVKLAVQSCKMFNRLVVN